MITKNREKTNIKATTTKKATQSQKKKNEALNLFFSLMGFILVMGSLMAMFVPTMANAKQGVIIVEPFECKTELANYHELLRALKVTPKDDFKYPIFEKELRLTVKALKVHKCEVK